MLQKVIIVKCSIIQIFYRISLLLSIFRVEEYWDPQMEGLEQIVITRQIPCIHILLSFDEIDPKTPG